MTIYRLIHDPIEAIQWTGDNIDLIEDFLAGTDYTASTSSYTDENVILCVSSPTGFGYRTHLDTTDWLIRTPSGLTVLIHDEFTSLFRSQPENPGADDLVNDLDTSGIGERQKAVLEFLKGIHREHPGAWSLTTTIGILAGPVDSTEKAVRSLARRNLTETASLTLDGKRRSITRINPNATNDNLFQRSITLANQMFKTVEDLNQVLAELGGNEHATITYIRKPMLVIDHHNGRKEPTHHEIESE